jgi:hypothetical protein
MGVGSWELGIGSWELGVGSVDLRYDFLSSQSPLPFPPFLSSFSHIDPATPSP